MLCCVCVKSLYKANTSRNKYIERESQKKRISSKILNFSFNLFLFLRLMLIAILSCVTHIYRKMEFPNQKDEFSLSLRLYNKNTNLFSFTFSSLCYYYCRMCSVYLISIAVSFISVSVLWHQSNVALLNIHLVLRFQSFERLYFLI